MTNKTSNTIQAIIFILVALSLGISFTTEADTFPPSNMCNKPYKPYNFNSQYEVDRFKEEVDYYRDCIDEFIEEQNEAIDNHSEAIDRAAREWENYVRHEI